MLEYLLEWWEETLLKAGNSCRVGLACCPDGYADALKQVVVEVWLAGILQPTIIYCNLGVMYVSDYLEQLSYIRDGQVC